MSFHIIGDKDSMLGFAFAGVTGDAVETADEARAALEAARKRSGTRILLVTHPVADMIESELVEHRMACEPPFIVEVGDLWETPVKRKTMEEMIYEAVGIRIRTRSRKEEKE